MAAFGRRNARTQNRRAPENYDHQVRAVSIPIRLLLWTRLASLSRVFTSISRQGIQTRFVVPSSDPSGLLSHQVLQTHFAVAGLPARSLPRFSVSVLSERLDSTLCLSLPARLPAGAFRAAPDGHARVKSTNRRRTAFRPAPTDAHAHIKSTLEHYFDHILELIMIRGTFLRHITASP